MYSFPDLEPACCSMSSSNWCFLRNQEADQVVWYSHLLKNFPQFVVIHTVKGFGVVNKTDVFLELSCFFDDPAGVGNLISGSSAFSKSSLDIWKFMVHILLKLQSCPTLCDPMDYSPSGSSCPWGFSRQEYWSGCHALLQGIFPTQGWNPGLLHCRWILHQQSHQGSL